MAGLPFLPHPSSDFWRKPLNYPVDFMDSKKEVEFLVPPITGLNFKNDTLDGPSMCAALDQLRFSCEMKLEQIMVARHTFMFYWCDLTWVVESGLAELETRFPGITNIVMFAAALRVYTALNQSTSITKPKTFDNFEEGFLESLLDDDDGETIMDELQRTFTPEELDATFHRVQKKYDDVSKAHRWATHYCYRMHLDYAQRTAQPCPPMPAVVCVS